VFYMFPFFTIYCLNFNDMIKTKSENRMKKKASSLLISLAVVPASAETSASNGSVSYFLGGIVALFILGYLVYTLLHPEKF
jgi:K+-transporting ATPase KdpF subunit